MEEHNWDILTNTVSNDIRNIGRYYKLIPCAGDALRDFTEKKPSEVRGHILPPQRIETLRRSFRSIPASPRNGGMYKIAYVIPSDIPEEAKPDNNLFLSPYTIKHIPSAINHPSVDPKLLAQSLAVRACILKQDLRHTECHVISGERGVGKTAFLNYLFSTQHAVFNEYNVIWVRIDLTLYEGLEHSLMEIIDIHTYDIICSRYLDGGFFPKLKNYFDDDDYHESVKAYKKRLDSLSVDKLKEYLKSTYLDNVKKRDIVTRLIALDADNLTRSDVTYAEKLKRIDIYRDFVIDNGYSFIYILDGLDEATIPMQEANIISKWRQNIIEIMQGKHVPDGLYMICARQESFRMLVDHIQSQSIPRDIREWLVWPVATREVLNTRVNLFEERIRKKEKKDAADYWETGSAKLVVNLTLFAINSAFNAVGIKEDILETFSKSGHMRSVLKFFRDAIWETMSILDEGYEMNIMFPKLANFLLNNPSYDASLKELILQKCYRIWAISSLTYENYFDQSIKYDPIRRKLIYPSKVGELPLIPVVWGDIQFPQSNQYHANHLLTKIRILQLLNSYKMYQMTFREIQESISSMFGYDPANVEIFLKAMILQRLIDFEPLQECLQEQGNSYIRITDLGSIVIEDWVFLPEYIEYTMHLAAVPITVRNEFPRFFIQRIGGPLSGGEQQLYVKTSEYLARLIPALGRFLALISAIERWEMTRFNLWRGQSGNERFGNYAPPLISTKAADRIIKKVGTILASARRNNKDDILKAVAAKYNLQNSETA